MTTIRAHHVAALTAAVTFLLLLLGNVVWGTGSSLACPDWPTCFGTFFPEMSGGVLYEHSHRLLGATVGVLTLTLALLLFVQRAPRRLRIAGIVAIAVVVFQGVLGGLTVLLRLPTLVSVAHLGTAMAFFSLLLWVAWSARMSDRPAVATGTAGKLVVFAYAMTYAQIVLGGLVRHTGSAAACVDLPLCMGQVWPAEAHPSALVHMSHRIGALVLCAVVIGVALFVLRSRTITPAVRALAIGAIALICVQFALGVYVVLTGLDLATVTAHLGVGALLLGDLLLLRLALARALAAPEAEPVTTPPAVAIAD